MLPGGTGNLLAVNPGLPDDLEGAIEVALHGARQRIDAGVIETRGLTDWVRLAVRVLLRAGGSGPPLELFRARSIQVECDRPQPYQLDGDTAGPVTRLSIDVAPAALTLCVPPPPPLPNPNPHQEAPLP